MSRRILLPFAVAAALLAPHARAEAPNLLTYQGRLKDSGAPVTGARGVEISLCSDEAGPTCTGTGPQGVTVANGLFRTTFTVPSPIALENGPWYIEVAIDGSALSPRERLSASAYALHATSATTLVPSAGETSVAVGSHLVLASGVSLAAMGSAPALSASDAAALYVDNTGTLQLSQAGGGYLRLGLKPEILTATCATTACTATATCSEGRVVTFAVASNNDDSACSSAGFIPGANNFIDLSCLGSGGCSRTEGGPADRACVRIVCQ